MATLQIDAVAETVSLVDPRVSRDGVPLCARHADSTTPPMGWTMNDLRSTSRALGGADEPLVAATPPRVRPSTIEDRPARRARADERPSARSQRGGATMSTRQSIQERARRTGGVEPVTAADDLDLDLDLDLDVDDNSDHGDQRSADVLPLTRDRRPAADPVARSGRSRAAADGTAPSSRPARRREATAETEEPRQQDLFPWHYEFDGEDEPEELHASSPLLSRAFRATIGH